MSHIKKSLINGLIAGIGVTAIAAVAAWQFYLFATFDAQGGTYHLLLAIAAALIACIAGFIAFSISVSYNEADEIHINS
jgi:uncharacterized membrane protein